MTKMKKLLFLFDTDPYASVFDTVVAYDGGADRVAGYANVTPDNVGPLVDGTIAGAGFDVLTKEPPKEGNILLDLKLPNLIVTPHVAWASVEAMQILADQLIDNVEAFVAGKPQNVVQE